LAIGWLVTASMTRPVRTVVTGRAGTGVRETGRGGGGACPDTVASDAAITAPRTALFTPDLDTARHLNVLVRYRLRQIFRFLSFVVKPDRGRVAGAAPYNRTLRTED